MFTSVAGTMNGWQFSWKKMSWKFIIVLVLICNWDFLYIWSIFLFTESLTSINTCRHLTEERSLCTTTKIKFSMVHYQNWWYPYLKGHSSKVMMNIIHIRKILSRSLFLYGPPNKIIKHLLYRHINFITFHQLTSAVCLKSSNAECPLHSPENKKNTLINCTQIHSSRLYWCQINIESSNISQIFKQDLS